MKAYVVVAVLAAAIATPAAGQSRRAAGAVTPLTAEGFRQAAIISDTFEIEASRNALQLSRDPRVRAYAERMIQDHTRTSQALMSSGSVAGTATGAVAGAVVGGLVGGPVGVVVGGAVGATTAAATGVGGQAYVAGPTLDARHADMLNRLVATRGAEFDRLYGQMQVAAHGDAVGLFTAYAQVGDDANLRAFARQTLPHLQGHLAMARSLPGAGGRARRR